MDKATRAKESKKPYVSLNSIIADDFQVAVLLKLLYGFHAPSELVELLFQDV